MRWVRVFGKKRAAHSLRQLQFPPRRESHSAECRTPAQTLGFICWICELGWLKRPILRCFFGVFFYLFFKALLKGLITLLVHFLRGDQVDGPVKRGLLVGFVFGLFLALASAEGAFCFFFSKGS